MMYQVYSARCSEWFSNKEDNLVLKEFVAATYNGSHGAKCLTGMIPIIGKSHGPFASVHVKCLLFFLIFSLSLM